MKLLDIYDNNYNCRWKKRFAKARQGIAAFFLCTLLGVSLAACSGQGSQNPSENSSSASNQQEDSNASKQQENSSASKEQREAGSSEQPENPSAPSEQQEDSSNAAGQQDPTAATEGEGTDSEQEPILDANASDEELLEILKDDIHVVTDGEFQQTVTGILENTADYTGQIYQFEGVFTIDGESACLAYAAEEGTPRLPLKYLKSDFKEGERIRVTGIVNQDKEESAAILEVIAAESLEETNEPNL